MSNLCQLSVVKARLAIDQANTDEDLILTNAIAAVSARFDRECNRTLARGAGVTCEFNAEEREILPPRYPIESVSAFAVKSNETDGFEAQSDVTYRIRGGVVIELDAALGTRAQIGRVTYTGGYVLPGSTATGVQTALPADLREAAVEQVAYWFQNRDRLGLVSVSGADASVQQFATLDLLPNVKSVLALHRRIRA